MANNLSSPSDSHSDSTIKRPDIPLGPTPIVKDKAKEALAKNIPTYQTKNSSKYESEMVGNIRVVGNKTIDKAKEYLSKIK